MRGSIVSDCVGRLGGAAWLWVVGVEICEGLSEGPVPFWASAWRGCKKKKLETRWEEDADVEYLDII